MKKLLFNFALAFSLVTNGFSTTLSVTSGDILLAFYQVDPATRAIEPNTYVYNLGKGASWRDNPANTVLITNLNADLTEVFGTGWRDDPKLRVLIAGGVAQTDPTTDQDPALTSYISIPMTNFLPPEPADWSWSPATRGGVSNAILGFIQGMNGVSNVGFLPNGAKVPTSNNWNVTKLVWPTTLTNFNQGKDMNAIFDAGNIGTATNYSVEAALAVYRVINTTSEAKLTATKSNTNAKIGKPQFIGCFTIDSDGNLRYDTPVAASNPNPYTTWAQTNNLTGANAAEDADPDSDLIPNVLEFVIGSNPNTSGDHNKLPTLTIIGPTKVFSFRRADESASLGIVVEYDEDLVAPWTVGNASNITVDNDFYGPGVDRVNFTFPDMPANFFARLRVRNP